MKGELRQVCKEEFKTWKVTHLYLGRNKPLTGKTCQLLSPISFHIIGQKSKPLYFKNRFLSPLSQIEAKKKVSLFQIFA